MARPAIMVLSPTPSLSAVASPVSNATALVAGETHGLMLDDGKAVWSFGDNYYGELGNNGSTDSPYLVRVKTMSGVNLVDLPSCQDVSAGKHFSAALGSDGSVYTWGARGSHRLGDGDSVGTRRYADKVKSNAVGNPSLSGIRAIEMGDTCGLAREAHSSEQGGGSGRVWGWGDNANGQLAQGNGINVPYATPLKLIAGTDLTDATDISAAGAHIAIVRWKTGEANLQGSVWCCGASTYGRLGSYNGSTSSNQTYPVQVFKGDGTALLNIVQVSAGSTHTLALDKNGHVWAWGYNGNGALGDGSNTNRNYAVQVRKPDSPPDPNPTYLADIERISAGGDGTSNFSTAVAKDGTIYTWGYNTSGQLGIGNDNNPTNRLPQVVATLRTVPNSPDVSITPEVTTQLEPGVATLTAIPSDADGIANIQKVEFFSQGVLGGTATAAP